MGTKPTYEQLEQRVKELEKKADRRKQAQEELKTLKTMKASILDAIPHAVIGIQQRQIFFANRGVETVFGWKPDELTGKSTRDLYRSDEEYEEIGGKFYPVLEGARTFSEEFPCRRKDGNDMMCIVSAARIGQRLEEKKIIAVYIDITEQKQAQRALKQAHYELESRVEERTAELAEVNEALHIEITEHKRVAEALCREKDKLEDALSEVKKLSGLLPICASCKKIRDDKGYWKQIESYIREHSEADFSHSICPECAQQLYQEFYPKSSQDEKESG